MTIEDFQELLTFRMIEEVLQRNNISEAEALYYLYEYGILEYGVDNEIKDDIVSQKEMGKRTSSEED